MSLHLPRSRRLRAVAVSAGALALVCAIAPLLPDSSSPRSAIRTQGTESQGTESGTAQPGVITPAMQAEIERVVAEGQQQRVTARTSTSERATAATRCAVFAGQRYCLGLGWTTQTQKQAADRMAEATTAATSTPRRARPETTGDLDPAALLRQRTRGSAAARARAERAELSAAARSVSKVWLLRHEIQGVALPAKFAATTRAQVEGRPGTKTAADYPDKFTILKPKQVRPQNRTYYCGPTAMQMIAWGWTGERRGQAYWASQLGTTSAGTAITDMVRVVNEATGYDQRKHAGDYITLDIGDFTYSQWYLLMMKHVHDYTAPVVLHPNLLKQYYPYLDDDASGHFQVGRGFNQDAAGKRLLGYFEPWDQSKFDPSEPRIARTQWQSAYKSYRANQAHFQHNVGL